MKKPDFTLGTLEDLAQQVLASQRELEAAHRAVAADKERRSTSVLARLVDAVLTTDAEARLQAAQDQLDRDMAAGRQAATIWVSATALAELATNTTVAAQHHQQTERLQSAKARVGRVKTWQNLAATAQRQVQRALTACDGAGVSEFFDATSKSKVVSAISSMSNEDAKVAVRDAEKALRDLATALPKRAAVPDIDLPDDIFDLAVDFILEPGLDVLSWFNLISYEQAINQCRDALDRLQPLNKQLHTLTVQALEKQAQEQAALDRIEEPFRAAAVARMPTVLQEPLSSNAAL